MDLVTKKLECGLVKFTFVSFDEQVFLLEALQHPLDMLEVFLGEVEVHQDIVQVEDAAHENLKDQRTVG